MVAALRRRAPLRIAQLQRIASLERRRSGRLAATLIIGRIWTANPEQPWAEAVAIDGERIVAVGSREDVEKPLATTPRRIDAGDGLVVPGLIDSHIHLIDGGLQLTSVQLRDAATREEFVRRIGEFAKKLPAGAWITGGDWDHTLWGGELPDAQLDRRRRRRHPVWINRLDGHMALANSAAMRAAGVGDDVKDVDGGEIVRDAAGRPPASSKTTRWALIDRAVPEPTLAQQLDATVAAMDYLAARGVTAVHHMGTWSHVDVFRLAQRRGLLKTRIYACTPLAQWQRLADEVASAGRGDEWLKIGGLKGYVDGSLGSHTAAFLEPFSDAPTTAACSSTRPRIWKRGRPRPIAPGLQVVVHAIGDRAIRLAARRVRARGQARMARAIGGSASSTRSTLRRRTSRGSPSWA